MRAVVLLAVFFNDTATTEIYTLSLHDALPIWCGTAGCAAGWTARPAAQTPAPEASPGGGPVPVVVPTVTPPGATRRSEEHTSELQSRQYLVCRLLLEKKSSRVYTAHAGLFPRT